ncbi:MAG: family 10 glycosylhydrolase [Acidobacteriota bacterium]|nr:family 10 glycosylhydrolase [Blastocatellia bacterium]MDW8239560.1 family 10 glycosylhydrolase [Acidobacteriota bacterium]
MANRDAGRTKPQANRSAPVALTAILFLCCLLPATCSDAVSSHTGRQDEVRALWVTRATLTSPEKIKQLINQATEAGFNTLIVQVRGRGDAYYQSRWEPRAKELTGQEPTFDPLALVLKEAKSANLKVHAWINTVLLANLDDLPPMPTHVLNKHPEWLAVHRSVAAQLYTLDPAAPQYRQQLIEACKRDMSELEGLYLSPAHPAVKEHLYSIFMDVLEKYDVHGLHFDYVRLPNPSFDYSRTALDRFRHVIEKQLSERERQLLARVAATDPLVYANTYPEEWQQFHRDQVTELVERIYHGVKARKPHVEVSAAVFGNDQDAFTRRFQDWKRWLRMGILDIVCPMAYSPDTETFRQQIAIAYAHAAGRRVWAGIGAYRIPVESTLEKIRTAREIGVQGFVLFSYDSAIRVSETNPGGDYLLRIKQAVLDAKEK